VAISPLSPVEDRLLSDILSYAYDPAGFVSYVFPWGEPGTTLEHEAGPDGWQIEVLDYLGQQLIQTTDAIRIAIASGHGIGKSSLIAWLILWFMSTKPHPQIPVTAGTAAQLATKTWRELAKWHRLALNSHWFDWTATKFARKGFAETWYASAIPWSKERAQSFAGTHEEHVLVLYDEGSTIDDAIWDVTEGAMSTPGAIWVVPGNPELSSGRFHDCFHRYRSLWKTWQIDARTAKQTNKPEIARQIAAYGDDSDFVRVRWLGKFPRQAPMQFISEALVEAAQQREAVGYHLAPVVLGVDVARFGDDETVVVKRQGPAVTYCKGYRGLRTDQTADVIATLLRQDQAIQQVFVDVVGIGAGVVDQLYRLGYRQEVLGVNAGEAATEFYPDTQTPKYFNLRAQMWGKMKEWLEYEGGCLPLEPAQLGHDVVGPQYGYAQRQQIQLERKEDMKARGLPSPDYGDALALTFARPLQGAQTLHRQQYAVATGNPLVTRPQRTAQATGRLW